MLTQSRPQQLAPAELRTVLSPRGTRIPRAAVVAAACLAVGTATLVIDTQPAPQVRSIAEPSQSSATRYFDVEANKVASMRALSGHIGAQQATPISRYQDLEANKALSRRAR